MKCLGSMRKILMALVVVLGVCIFSLSSALAAINPVAFVSGKHSGSLAGSAIDVMVEGFHRCTCKVKCWCDKHAGRHGHWWKISDTKAIDFNATFKGLTAGSYKTSSVFVLDDSAKLTDNVDKITGKGYINVQVKNSEKNMNYYDICDTCEERVFTDFKEWLHACITHYGDK